MSVPAPLTVNTPLVKSADPATVGAPTSVSLQGGGTGFVVVPVLKDTLSKAALLYCPMLCDVTNSPMVTGPFMVTVVEPICTQLTPSTEYHDVKVLPFRCSLSHLFGEAYPA